MLSWSRRLLFTLSAVLTAGVAMAGGPPSEVLDRANPRVREVMEIQEEVTPSLMASPDVLGTAAGLDEEGRVAVVVYLNRDGRTVAEIVRAMPKAIGGAPVVIELTEPFRALHGKPGGSSTVSHTARQTPPVELGTSGGWGGDLANGYCCGGTLGSLIQINGTQYVLSNYHVLEADIVSGGNNRIAVTGDPVIQPGLIDVGCNAESAQSVATLVKSASLPNSNVDAAIAKVVPGMVRSDGAILEIGTISSDTVAASIGQAVKKSGRTSGLSRSKVSGLNATVSVAYDNECAGGSAFTKMFTGQIIVGNRAGKFLAAGDSGSLMVEDKTTNPGAVGLLFAGSSSLAVANPIHEVLAFFSATMVGVGQ